MKIKNRYFLQFLFLIVAFSSYSQSDPNNLVFNGNKESIKKNYTKAEVEYRKAISDDKGQSKAAHNLGNIHFLKMKIMMRQFKSILKLKKILN